MNDLIDRQYAIENYQHVCRRTSCKECPLHTKSTSFGSGIHEFSDCELELFLRNLPSIDIPINVAIVVHEDGTFSRITGLKS